MEPTQHIALARKALEASGHRTAVAIARLQEVEKLLEPASEDTVTACLQLREVASELEALTWILPSTAAKFEPMKQDSNLEFRPGVADAIEHVNKALNILKV